MNLIPCALCCVHQKEGYCSLALVPQGSGSRTAGEFQALPPAEDCLYFSPAAGPQPMRSPASETERTPTSSNPSSPSGPMR